MTARAARAASLRRADLALLAGVAASCVLHVTLLWPATVRLLSADVRRPIPMLMRFEPRDIQEPSREPLFLGIDAPTPSTLTWIGYEQYRLHMAALAEVDQAAFRTSPPGAEPESGAPTGAAAEPDESAASSEQPQVPPQEALRHAAAEQPPPKPPIEQPPREAAHARQPAPAEAPPGEQPDPADVSDLESDPTSTVEAPWEKLTLGQPLAAPGLTLKPRKPVFTTWVRFTAAPADPLVAIEFGRDGIPVRARIEESSGDPRVDDAIESCLYRWRAAGERLEGLRGDEAATVRLRIILHRRR
jgi:outer membrane biosynthesis protein TonB